MKSIQTPAIKKITKPKQCQWDGCYDSCVNFQGSTIRKKYCQHHYIMAAVTKARDEKTKERADLEEFKATYKKKTPREEFYSSTAWRYFSHYVLLFYADSNLEARCSTDPALTYPINSKLLAVGHWIKVFDQNSTNYNTAFDFRNVGPQSVQQNVHAGGNQPEMEKWITQTHGAEAVEELLKKKQQPLRLDKYELDQIATKYKGLLKDEIQRRGIRDPWAFKR